MLQQIAPSIFHNEYKPVPPGEDDIVFFFRERTLLAKGSGKDLALPLVHDIADDAGEIEPFLQYLFRIDDRCAFLWVGGETPLAEGFSMVEMAEFRKGGPDLSAFAVMTAWHLYVWYRDNRYCGRCGKKTRPDDVERALRCDCGNIIYPKICPAVIVGVTDGDRIVVTRYAGRAYKGYALIAGFCEIGETAEETVKREVMEEVGLHVKNIRYVASQPWGFESDLLLGYYCDVDGDPTIHRDENELAVAMWKEREELEPPENTRSLTATLLEKFRTGCE